MTAEDMRRADALLSEIEINIAYIDKNLLVVKPLVSKSIEAKKLINLSKGRKKVYQVEFHKRFDEANLILKKLINENRFGALKYCVVEYSQKNIIPKKYFKKWSSKSNSFQYLGTHYVDLILYITGYSPKKVWAWEQSGYLKNNKIMECDFIFDCSGFSKALLGKHFNCNWLSYKKHLPVKKTILFPENKENFTDIFPYTKSIAMKYGWIFEIPLQNRIGKGYIFDSDYINEMEAHHEAEKFYNKKIDVKRSISFETGRFDKAWVKNCIGLGLSQNFIEPLESTKVSTSTKVYFIPS
jgi:hypothetical protein